MTQHTVAIVVYCPSCDYFLKTAVQEGAVGTHGCAQCNGLMEVYVAFKGFLGATSQETPDQEARDGS